MKAEPDLHALDSLLNVEAVAADAAPDAVLPAVLHVAAVKPRPQSCV